MTDEAEPLTVYVVTSHYADDDPAVFATEALANRYADTFSPQGVVDELLVCDGELAEKMIREASSDDLSRAPYGIHWPADPDGWEPPDGWSWVEKGDEEDEYATDEDAARELVRLGIGTEWRYFHRETLEDRSQGDAAIWADLSGCSVAINVPDPTTGTFPCQPHSVAGPTESEET